MVGIKLSMLEAVQVQAKMEIPLIVQQIVLNLIPQVGQLEVVVLWEVEVAMATQQTW